MNESKVFFRIAVDTRHNVYVKDCETWNRVTSFLQFWQIGPIAKNGLSPNLTQHAKVSRSQLVAHNLEFFNLLVSHITIIMLYVVSTFSEYYLLLPSPDFFRKLKKLVNDGHFLFGKTASNRPNVNPGSIVFLTRILELCVMTCKPIAWMAFVSAFTQPT